MDPRCELFLKEMNHHLHNELMPFWLTHGVDEKYGGYLTYLDKDGNPTGEGVKTHLCQCRMIYTYSSAHRAGLGEGKCLEIARQGVDFMLQHFWDQKYGGWFWTCEQDGALKNVSKLTYGHAFAIYCLSEYYLASHDPRGLEWALKTYDILQGHIADNFRGGYYEFLERDFSKKRPGKYGGDRKSFDVHMHLMEALTTLAEATGSRVHRDRTIEVVDLIFHRILDPKYGTGRAQFTLAWEPLRAILFADVWGADRDVEDDEGRPLDNTSFGHNVEFAWLLNHTVKILGLDRSSYREAFRKLYDHAVKNGVDWERGGVYCEGPNEGPARERNKEFWQQAECLTGFLDAYLLFGEKRYLDAYENVHRFVIDTVINHAVGEWYPLFDENNHRMWDYMAHAWKINYHTVRAAIQTVARLNQICAQ